MHAYIHIRCYCMCVYGVHTLTTEVWSWFSSSPYMSSRDLTQVAMPVKEGFDLLRYLSSPKVLSLSRNLGAESNTSMSKIPMT